MNAINIISLWQILASIAALLWLSRLWRNLVVDATRQSLFEIRDTVFDLAADGSIGFEQQTYRELRQRINGSIRFCDHYSLTAFMLAAMKAGLNPKDDELRIQIQRLSDKELSRKLMSEYQRSIRIVVSSLVLRSLFGLVAATGAVLVVLVIAVFDGQSGIDGTKTNFAKIERRVAEDVSMAPAC